MALMAGGHSPAMRPINRRPPRQCLHAQSCKRILTLPFKAGTAIYTDKGGCFSTYAYRLIWNEICTALLYASRRSRTEYATDPELLIAPSLEDNFTDEYGDIKAILDRALAEASGVTAKGIQAIKLTAQGYTSREIGAMMSASPNNVTAWISKARKYLRTRPEFAAL